MNHHTPNRRQWNGRTPPDYTAVFVWRAKRIQEVRADKKIQAALGKPPRLLPGMLEFYRTHPVEFISEWCDTFDPRLVGTDTPARLPFVLFPRQQEAVQFLWELVQAQTGGLFEKSRDAGLTWLACAFSAWLWRFWDGSSIGWGSRKAELVDRIGDMDSIFEKIRTIIAGWPREFWPAGYVPDQHGTYMKILNPENDNSITGESGDNIGRGGRKLVYFKDESAHYDRPELIEAALGDNTNVQVDISSVNGLGNVFHRRREAGTIWQPGMQMVRGVTYVFIVDWSDDPRKTPEWYEARRAKAEAEGLSHIFEQEVNRNYSAAVSGVIIPQKFVLACIDAHRLIPGMDDGKWIGALDPADPTGTDPSAGDGHAAGARKGVVLRYSKHWNDGDVGDATRRTIQALRALSDNMDVEYDSVGVGAGVKSEINRLMALPSGDAEKLPTGMRFVAWNAGAAVLNPDDPITEPMPGEPLGRVATNKEQYANLKAQAWWAMRTRCEKTMKAVEAVKAGLPNPYTVDELCSFDSASIDRATMAQLTKEMSQPVRKKDLVSTKLTVDKKPAGTRSPNLADKTVMLYFPVPVEGYDWSAWT